MALLKGSGVFELVFGEYFIENETRITIDNFVFSFKRLNEKLVKVTADTGKAVIGKLVELERPEPMSLKPIPPIAGSIDVTCVYYVLEEPLIIPPFTKVELVVDMPYDVGVFKGEERIVSIPLGKVKYALYGTPDMGDLCRYVSPEILASYGSRIAKLKLVITSSAKNSVEIRKIVAPMADAAVALTKTGKVYYSTVLVNVISSTHVEVNVRKELSVKGEDYSVIIVGREASYIMRYGV